MKKLFYFLLTIVLFTACTSNSIESDAKEQMKKTLAEFMKDPSSMSINNEEIVFSDDSICVIQANVSGKNGFGGVSNSRMEYIYRTEKKEGKLKYYESLQNLEDKGTKSIMERAKEHYQYVENEHLYSDDSNYAKMTEAERKADAIHFIAAIALGYREVNSKKKDNDIDNW